MAVFKSVKDSALTRWSALILVSLVMFSSYYFYDLFSGIKSQLQAETGISNAGYGQMYGAYSFTNSILLMTFFGGMILDLWGIRKTGMLFIAFITIGSFGTAYGASSFFHEGAPFHRFLGSFLPSYSPALKMMVIGRLVFGLGAETFYVVINKIIARWFKGKELALAFGISLALGRFGTAAALTISPWISGELPHSNITPAAWLGVMLAIAGFLAYLFYLIFDLKLDRELRSQETGAQEKDQLKLTDLLKLLTNRSFIYITLLCITFYSAVFPFLGYAPDFLHNKFGFNTQLSGAITSILPYGTILFTPLFGWFCDTRGRSASVMLLGSSLLILVHLTFGLTNFMPYIPLFLLGIAFSLVPSAMWPSVAKIVDEKRLGTAYGFMFTIQNFGLMLFPYIIGLVLDGTNKNAAPDAPLNYTYAILMLAFLGFLGLLFAWLLLREDKKSGFGLELPNKQK